MSNPTPNHQTVHKTVRRQASLRSVTARLLSLTLRSSTKTMAPVLRKLPCRPKDILPPGPTNLLTGDLTDYCRWTVLWPRTSASAEVAAAAGYNNRIRAPSTTTAAPARNRSRRPTNGKSEFWTIRLSSCTNTQVLAAPLSTLYHTPSTHPPKRRPISSLVEKSKA
jgi:hypothetical protein